MRLFPECNVKAIGWAIARVSLCVYVLYGAMLFVRQDTLLYFPDQTPFTDCEDLSVAERVNIEGTRGYFFQNGTSTKLAVFYHGNAGRACDRAYYRTALEHAGYSWLFVEYSGYAGDGKKPSTASVLQDAAHVVAWIHKNKFTAVAVIGESIGSGPASYHSSLASVDKLILITPFITIADVAQSYYPFYPMSLLLRDDFANDVWAAHAKQVLVIHGTKDTIVPFSYGKALFEFLPQVEKEFLVLPGIDHNDAPALGETQRAIMKFLRAP